LDTFTVLGVPAGFWFAQQGAIWVFLAVLAYYGWASHRLDQKFDVDDD
jgi:putative solute:sodium symporter small subunit